MKFVAWNCQGAFRKKAKLIAQYAPDIAVISECEHPDRLHFESGIEPPITRLWFGDSETKGVGIFSYTGVNLELHKNYKPSIRYCIPIVATGNLNLNIVSVYHAHFQEAFGEETVSTLYMQRKREKGYHVDYCFVPQAWIKRVTFFSVGSFDDWSSLSDHSPIFVEFRQ